MLEMLIAYHDIRLQIDRSYNSQLYVNILFKNSIVLCSVHILRTISFLDRQNRQSVL